jgi:hypothetical protein
MCRGEKTHYISQIIRPFTSINMTKSAQNLVILLQTCLDNNYRKWMTLTVPLESVGTQPAYLRISRHPPSLLANWQGSTPHAVGLEKTQKHIMKASTPRRNLMNLIARLNCCLPPFCFQFTFVYSWLLPTNRGVYSWPISWVRWPSGVILAVHLESGSHSCHTSDWIVNKYQSRWLWSIAKCFPNEVCRFEVQQEPSTKSQATRHI